MIFSLINFLYNFFNNLRNYLSPKSVSMITSIITKSKSEPLINQGHICQNNSTTIFTFSTLYAIIYTQ